MVRGDDKREAILEAACVLFGERGFHGTAVPEIAARAGVGAGTIYRHFASKEELVNALYQQWKRALLDVVLADFPLDRPLREQFLTLWSRWAGFFVDHPEVALFLELHHHAPYLDATSRAYEAQALEMAAAVMAQGRAAGVLKSLPDGVIVALVQGSLIGLVQAHQRGKLVLDGDIVRAAGQCVWEAIRA